MKRFVRGFSYDLAWDRYANTPLSIAIVKDGELLVEENSSMAINHSLRAMPAIEEIFTKVGMTPTDIDAIAVSEGPGSYTGVRIGVTIAKTLAWTLDKPLVGVSSLKALAANGTIFKVSFAPIVDARRGNVYAGAYQIIKADSLQQLLMMDIILLKN